MDFIVLIKINELIDILFSYIQLLNIVINYILKLISLFCGS